MAFAVLPVQTNAVGYLCITIYNCFQPRFGLSRSCKSIIIHLVYPISVHATMSRLPLWHSQAEKDCLELALRDQAFSSLLDAYATVSEKSATQKAEIEAFKGKERNTSSQTQQVGAAEAGAQIAPWCDWCGCCAISLPLLLGPPAVSYFWNNTLTPYLVVISASIGCVETLSSPIAAHCKTVADIDMFGTRARCCITEQYHSRLIIIERCQQMVKAFFNGRKTY
jgi:hypothetical protein